MPMHESAGSVTAQDLLEEAIAAIERLSPTEAADALANGAILVDTRSSEDRRSDGVVGGALSVAMSVLEWRADPTSPTRDERLLTGARLIVMCNDGYSSALSARNLRRLGHHDAADVEGGYQAWRAKGLATE